MEATTIPLQRIVFSDIQRDKAFSTITQFRGKMERKPRPKRGTVNVECYTSNYKVINLRS